MAVYSYKMLRELENSLQEMAKAFFSRMPLVLSPEEFIDAFIAPDHVAQLKGVQDLVGEIGRASGTMKLRYSPPDQPPNPVPVRFQFSNSAPLLIPRYVDGGMLLSCSPTTREKIEDWVSERVKFGYMFGDAYDALNWLNDECFDANTVTLLFPCYPTIMSRINPDAEATTNKRARALSGTKKAGQIPLLPREVKNRLQEISAVVNSVSLMEDAPDIVVPKHHAHISYNTEYFAVAAQPIANRINIFYQHRVTENTTVPISSFL